MISHWLFCIQNQRFLSTCGACLDVVFQFECKLFRSFEGQTRFSTSWHAKMSLTLNEPVWNVLCSNLHRPPSMHQKPIKGIVCKTTNS